MVKSVIDQIGGEDGVRKLVECFYDLIETLPQGKEILRMHQDGHGLRHARIEQFNFLCGFLGGRRYYLETHRHLNVKQMHEHLRITHQLADDWLFCMKKAMDQCDIKGDIASQMITTLHRVAMHLVNEPKHEGMTEAQ